MKIAGSPATIEVVPVRAAPFLLALLMSCRALSMGDWCTCFQDTQAYSAFGSCCRIRCFLAFEGKRFGCGPSVRACLRNWCTCVLDTRNWSREAHSACVGRAAAFAASGLSAFGCSMSCSAVVAYTEFAPCSFLSMLGSLQIVQYLAQLL